MVFYLAIVVVEEFMKHSLEAMNIFHALNYVWWKIFEEIHARMLSQYQLLQQVSSTQLFPSFTHLLLEHSVFFLYQLHNFVNFG